MRHGGEIPRILPGRTKVNNTDFKINTEFSSIHSGWFMEKVSEGHGASGRGMSPWHPVQWRHFGPSADKL